MIITRNYMLKIPYYALLISAIIQKCSNVKIQMPQYQKKLNESGEYLPFYGYTCIAFLEPDAQPLCEAIENFIKSSTLKNYMSPLPAWTYHMTIFSIYPIARKPIPPVQRWMDETKEELPKVGWLPEKVLKAQHTRAIAALEKMPKRSDILATMFYEEALGILGIRLKLSNESDRELQSLRRNFAEIYEHPDTSLQGEGTRINWHITLAYRYRQLPLESSKEWAELANDFKVVMRMASGFSKYSLVKHNIYLYDSMTNFIPI